MTSQIWVKGYKLSAVLGTVFGLLLPGLPLLATPSDIVEKSSSATSGDLLIAQASTACVEGDREYDIFTTESGTKISICQQADGQWYIGLQDPDKDSYTFIFDATLLEDGSYRATNLDDAGNEFVYTVGDTFQMTHNGKILVEEKIIK